MTRLRLSTRASLRASLAAALLLYCGTAAAQQFEFVRDFDVLRRSTDGRLLQNVYWVSLPLVPVVVDTANTAAAMNNKCVGDATGPATPDGVLNVDDLICVWWTARASPYEAGHFSITILDANTCTPLTRIATVAVGAVRFAGIAFPLEYDESYQVQVGVTGTSTASPRNRAILKGLHDLNWTGRPINAPPTCPTGSPNCCGSGATRRELLHFPYDSLLASANEILCGLENVDWQDTNSDGKPDTCWDDADGDGAKDADEETTGVFDGRHGITVSTWVNDEVVNGPASLTATSSLGSLRFAGTNFPLQATQAYLLSLSPLHDPTLWMPARP